MVEKIYLAFHLIKSLVMKKSLLTLLSSMFLSVAALAASDQKQDQGDPKKEKETKAPSSFSLTEGYFSLFDIFKDAPKPDSLLTRLPVPPSKSGATIKK